MLPNILQYPVALCGILRAGLVVVNVNPLYTPRELKHQLSDSGAQSIIILDNFAHVLAEIIDEPVVEQVILPKVGDLLSFPKNHIINFVLKYIKKVIPEYKLNSVVSFQDTLDKKDHQTLDPVTLVKMI